jgi:hypothetical protein|tara:strand:+ start:102 stop:461 length:360 start_codon:yes stop_codon:yes gene_type:complete
MDEASLLDLLINSSPLAGFAAYLVFQTKGLQKRMDSLNQKAVDREDMLRNDQQEHITMLRGRYDKVISDLQSEKAVLQTTNHNALTALEKKVDALVMTVESINQVVQELKFKDIARDIK